MDPKHRNEIANNDRLSTASKRVTSTKLTQESVKRLEDEGKSNLEIAEILGLHEKSVRMLLKKGPSKGVEPLD